MINLLFHFDYLKLHSIRKVKSRVKILLIKYHNSMDLIEVDHRKYMRLELMLGLLKDFV